MANKIQLRRDTADNWNRVNPVLDDGEPGLDIDSNQIKYGDGATAWMDLPYASGGGGVSFEYSTVQEGLSVGPGAGGVTSITGDHATTTGVGLTSEHWAQLMWVPDTSVITVDDIDNGPAVYNWAYVDDYGFHIDNKIVGTTNGWLFDRDGVLNFPNNNGQIGQLEPPYTGLEFRTGSGADWIGISYGEINDNNTSYFYFDKDGSDYLTANHRAHLQIKNPAHDGHVEWLFESDGTTTFPTGGRIGATKGGTMLDGGYGGSTSLTTFYASENYAACVTGFGNGTLDITTYKDGGVDPSRTWTFDNDGNLTLPVNGDILVNGGANSAIHDLLQNDVHTDADHYTLALSDRGKMIYQTGGYNVIVPAADGSTITFPVSTVITIVNSGGAGDLNIVAADGGTNTDIYGAGTDTNSYVWALPSNSIATLIKVEGSGTYSKWLLSGVGIYDNS